MAKPRIAEVIVVEGRYDKNTLLQTVEATVVETGGFGVFRQKGQAGPAPPPGGAAWIDPAHGTATRRVL